MTSRRATSLFTIVAGLQLASLWIPARALAGNAAPASADDERACTAAYDRAQERERSARLIEAKNLFLACAKPACGSFLQQECGSRYTQLNSDIPSVVPLVLDEAGAPRIDVKVKMDGELLTSRLDGRALPVDPGLHEFTFSADGTVFATQKILIAQGQRNRSLSISMGTKKGAAVETAAVDAAAPQATAGEDRPKSGLSALTYALGGTGLAGVGAFALLTYWGRKDNDKLSQCAPHCSQVSVDHVHNLYVAADVSLGVGLAALGAAYWVFARSRAATDERPAEEAYLFNVQPTSAGALATFSGSF